MAKLHIPKITAHLLFTLFYRTLFAGLYLSLLALILITPGDAITQALQNNQLYNVFVIAAAYFLTAFLAALIYASRIYTTRSVLNAIPRGWIPVSDSEVESRVRREVAAGWGRSAGIAYLSRPRADHAAGAAINLAEEPALHREETRGERWRAHKVVRKLVRKNRPGTARPLTREEREEQEKLCVAHGEKVPVWGVIEHQGWSGPEGEVPNLAYRSVIEELPHLIEAKVVALSGASEENLRVLTRKGWMGLREYLGVLVEVGCLDDSRPPAQGKDGDREDGEQAGTDWREWLAAYERARFSGRYPTEAEFKYLTAGFAGVLDRIRGLQGQEGAHDDADDSDSDWEVVQRDGDKLTPESSLKSKRSQMSMRSYDSQVLGSESTVERTDFALPHRVPSRNATPASRFNPDRERFGNGMDRPDMRERGGEVDDERLSRKETESLRSFGTESDVGSVIRNSRSKMM